MMTKKGSLEGKTALVTGGSKGIGLAIADRLGGLGAKVAICGRNTKSLEEAAKRLGKMAPAVAAIVADVSVAERVAAMVAEVEKQLGPIDILVNNAGIGVFGPAYKISEADWNRVMDTNLKSVYLCSRAVVPGMISRGGGDIINVASLAGKNTFAGGAVYCASKWGLLGFTHSMAEDVREQGIRVAAVCPGSVATDFSPQGSAKDPSRMLQAEDVAHVVGMMVTAEGRGLVSEVSLRPARKP
jgi:3-oxoacyl-[acyl-carrier protein] reductase